MNPSISGRADFNAPPTPWMSSARCAENRLCSAFCVLPFCNHASRSCKPCVNATTREVPTPSAGPNASLRTWNSALSNPSQSRNTATRWSTPEIHLSKLVVFIRVTQLSNDVSSRPTLGSRWSTVFVINSNVLVKAWIAVGRFFWNRVSMSMKICLNGPLRKASSGPMLFWMIFMFSAANFPMIGRYPSATCRNVLMICAPRFSANPVAALNNWWNCCTVFAVAAIAACATFGNPDSTYW